MFVMLLRAKPCDMAAMVNENKPKKPEKAIRMIEGAETSLPSLANVLVTYAPADKQIIQ